MTICCKCGKKTANGNFIPIEPKGTPDRKWVCETCADLIQKQQAKNALGKEALELARIFSPNFLK